MLKVGLDQPYPRIIPNPNLILAQGRKGRGDTRGQLARNIWLRPRLTHPTSGCPNPNPCLGHRWSPSILNFVPGASNATLSPPPYPALNHFWGNACGESFSVELRVCLTWHG